jgi:WD40 repeat protein
MLALQAGLKRVECLAFSPSGSRLAVGGRGLEVWTVLGHRPVWQWHTPGQQDVRAAVFAPDDDWVFALAPGDTGRAYDTSTGSEHLFGFPLSVYMHRPQFWSVDRTGGRILVGTGDRLACWGLNTTGRRSHPMQDPVLWDITHQGIQIGAAALVPGQPIVVALARRTSRSADQSDNALIVLSPETGRLEREHRSGYWRADHLTASPDGLLLVGVVESTLLIWDTARLHRPPIRRENDTRRQFTGLAFHPFGGLLATASNDKVVKLWDVERWTVLREFTWKAGRMRSIAFSPDGLTAAAGGEDGQFVLFDVDL